MHAEDGQTDELQLKQRMIVVLGPTAGGKSALSVGLAKAFDGEVVNADSMQVYKYLDAGTAKPSEEEMRAVRHHLVDVVDPRESWTVHDWLREAEGAIEEIDGRGKRVIIAGGTNLYMKALLEGMFDGPGADEAYRKQLEAVESGELYEKLREVDPEAVERIFPNDRRRVIRALEVYHLTGKPISELQQQWAEKRERGYRYDPILIGLRWEVDKINRRINARVKGMFDPEVGEGLIEETKRLEEAGLLGNQAREALGTKQVLLHLGGKMSADEARERVKIETRQFAKSQRTWMKRYRGVNWIEASAYEGAEMLGEAIKIVNRYE